MIVRGPVFECAVCDILGADNSPRLNGLTMQCQCSGLRQTVDAVFFNGVSLVAVGTGQPDRSGTVFRDADGDFGGFGC